MAINLIIAVQQHLKLPEIHKVIPESHNQDQIQEAQNISISQVALVCVTAALYKITRTTEGCVKLLLSGKNDKWLSLGEAYGERLSFVYEKVGEYGIADHKAIECLFQDIANACLLVIHETLAHNISTESVKALIGDQRHSILMYKPVELDFRLMLNDSVLDDQTNKMEGPVSNLMHKIENLFS